MNSLRIVFMGSAGLACASLQKLVDSDQCDVIAVVTQPDKPKGRALKSLPTPVGELAGNLGIDCHKPKRARGEEFVELIRELTPELIVVVAYGQILSQELLDIPKFGCLNVHTSILPKYRGAAPIQWAIVDGEPETGVTIMKMDAGLDTGDIVAERRTHISETDNAQTLHDRLALIGAELLLDSIPAYVGGSITPSPQPPDGATYARKISKKDGLIDWSRPAREIFNQIRGFTPWPGAFTVLSDRGKQKILKIWEAHPTDSVSGNAGEVVDNQSDELVVTCGEGALKVTVLQKEGSRRMAAKEFLQGSSIPPGTKLG